MLKQLRGSSVPHNLRGPVLVDRRGIPRFWNDGSILIANVHSEIDEASAFNAQFEDVVLGGVARKDCQLVSRARFPTVIRRSSVTLHDDLPSTGTHQAGFRRCPVMLGEGAARRILWEIVRA